MSELNAPLRELKQQEEWKWDDKEKVAFENLKKALTSTPVLKYYDVRKPVTIAVDASMKGVGAASLYKTMELWLMLPEYYPTLSKDMLRYISRKGNIGHSLRLCEISQFDL